MSQMQIAESIQQEINSIEEAQKDMNTKKGELRDFVLKGEEFIDKPLIFDRLLSEWSDTLLTLVEAVGRSFNMEGHLGISNPNPLLPNNRYTHLEDSNITVTKAAIVIAGIIAGVALCYLFPKQYAIGVGIIAVACIAPFFRNIANMLRGEEEEKKPESLNALSDRINESISMMRDKHAKQCFRLKFKQSDPNRLYRHDPKEDKALYDYKQQILEKLPRWCMNRIDDITVQCNGVAFGRKMVLYGYWHGGSSNHQQQPNQGKPN